MVQKFTQNITSKVVYHNNKYAPQFYEFKNNKKN